MQAKARISINQTSQCRGLYHDHPPFQDPGLASGHCVNRLQDTVLTLGFLPH